jgi:predicted phosphodiesterase
MARLTKPRRVKSVSEKSSQHDLVAFITSLALELGRTPTYTECGNRYRGFRYQTEKGFGSFSALIQAAGLEPDPKSRVLVSSDVFKRDIEKHLDSYLPRGAEPVPVVAREKTPTFAVISDIHFPFENQKVIDAWVAYIKKMKPDFAFLNGDAWDLYSHAKFPRSHNVFTPRDEQRLAREKNEKLWRDVQAASPKTKCIQMLGNHDVRPMKRILEAYPEAEDWISEKLKELFTFENVETIFDARQEFIIGPTAIFHGYRSQLGAHRDFTLMNCVNGHTHQGGVVYRQVRGSVIWELNSGFAGDPNAKGLTYTAQRITRWTPGFGAHDEFGPRFITVE